MYTPFVWFACRETGQEQRWSDNHNGHFTEDVNSVIPGRCGCNLKYASYILISWVFPEKLLSCQCHRTHWWWVNIGSGNGLVPSGNKPLPEPMLTHIYVTVWRHYPTMSSFVINKPNSDGDISHVLVPKTGSGLLEIPRNNNNIAVVSPEETPATHWDYMLDRIQCTIN